MEGGSAPTGPPNGLGQFPNGAGQTPPNQSGTVHAGAPPPGHYGGHPSHGYMMNQPPYGGYPPGGHHGPPPGQYQPRHPSQPPYQYHTNAPRPPTAPQTPPSAPTPSETPEGSQDNSSTASGPAQTPPAGAVPPTGPPPSAGQGPPPPNAAGAPPPGAPGMTRPPGHLTHPPPGGYSNTPRYTPESLASLQKALAQMQQSGMVNDPRYHQVVAAIRNGAKKLFRVTSKKILKNRNFRKKILQPIKDKPNTSCDELIMVLEHSQRINWVN